jgi:two-component system, chemotaxis family, response regulator Rcp1
MKVNASWPVLVAEDNPDDFLLLEAAWKRAGKGHALVCEPDGVALLQRLRLPGMRAALVLMDLKMPRMNGLEALAEMKADPRLASIPVVMFSTSRLDRDVHLAYQLGASSYVFKPLGMPEFVRAATLIRNYWLELIEVPE